MTPDDPTGGGGGGVGAWLGRSIDWLHQLGTIRILLPNLS